LMKELPKRIIVALIGVPLVIFIMYLGGVVFNMTMLIISSIALLEYYKLAEKKGLSNFLFIVVLCSILPAVNYFILSLIFWGEKIDIMYVFLEYFVLFFLMPIYFLFSKGENFISALGVVFTGLCYILLPFFCLILIRELDNGFYWTILTFSTIWVCDSAAYFVGRKFGKHKLAPTISPKKSIEGAIAGFVVSAVYFVLMSNYLIENISLLQAIILGIIIGIFGQIGDLIESKIKRDADVKDSSNIIPGHGGVLDRFDSIIFVAPFVYIILVVFSKIA